MICFTTLSTEIYKRALLSVGGLLTAIVPDNGYTLLGEEQLPTLVEIALMEHFGFGSGIGTIYLS